MDHTLLDVRLRFRSFERINVVENDVLHSVLSLTGFFNLVRNINFFGLGRTSVRLRRKQYLQCQVNHGIVLLQ
ncbi:hypothetical protein Plhal304r1_c007g0029981 [Plasmopara halstedii]